MNALQTFTYRDTPLRTVEKDSELWWVLKDVCNALGIVDHKSVKRRLDDDERGVYLVPTPGGTQNMAIVNEPGLYNVILQSAKPEAKNFKRWVTHEVLPSIRKSGTYSLEQTQPMTPAQLLAAQAKVLVEMEQRMDEMQSHTAALEVKVDTALKAFSRPAQDHWKDDTHHAIQELCESRHLSITATKGRMYAELERAAGCSINARLNRLRERKKKAGMRHRDAMELNKLDAIGEDKHLRIIFEGIVRSWQAQALPTE